jgi:hypothetical protein
LFIYVLPITNLEPSYPLKTYNLPTYFLPTYVCIILNPKPQTYLLTYLLVTNPHPTYLWWNLLSMKQGSSFCLSCRDLQNHGASCHTLGVFKKLLMSRGALNWFETLLKLQCGRYNLLNLFFMKIKQNQNWKLQWNWGGHSWCCWKAFSKSDLIDFISQFLELIRCERYWVLSEFCCWKFKKKLQKIGFGGKNQLSPECVHTWANRTGYSSRD